MDNTVMDKIKVWVFGPLTALLVWFIADTLKSIRKDLDMVKSDVKILLAQSSTDGTRIDILEKDVDKLKEKLLYNQTQVPKPKQAIQITRLEALRPEDSTIKVQKEEPYKTAI